MEPLSTKVEGWSTGYQVDTDMLGMSGKIMAFEVNCKKYEANGPVDIIVSEMLKELCVESIYEMTEWFQRRFRVECAYLASWTMVQLVFPRKPDAAAEGIRGDSRCTPGLDGEVVLIGDRADVE